MPKTIEVDVAIIGAGTAGLGALRQVKAAGKSFVLIERGELGTMCARVGCIPSKAVLHASELIHTAAALDDAMPAARRAELASRLWQQAREVRDRSADAMAKETLELAAEGFIPGDARLVSANEIQVGAQLVRARAIVIATGSTPVLPDEYKTLGDGVLTTDSLFDLNTLPSSIGLVGLGAIGLEMGVALSRLGVRVTGADKSSIVGGIRDPLIASTARRSLGRELTIWLDAPVHVKRHGNGKFELLSGENEERRAEVESVLVALGRRSTLAELHLHNAGIDVDENGKVEFDAQTMRIGDSNFYLAGDVDNERPLKHEAADEGSIAGWNAARHHTNDRWKRRVPLSIAFTNPDIGAIGCPFDKLPAGTLVAESKADSNARSSIAQQPDNVVRLYAEPETGKLLGAAVFSGSGEHLAHLLALAIQRGETAESLLQMPFYHPTVEELLQTALRDAVSKTGGSKQGLELELFRPD
ncbi:dihydrolipoyl dehydrogenase [Paraburkholderia sp. BCC1886]|uniref:dihydrolipoyl dehydrogenase n=1 Tax=Paraburkholderia sp. BCC1886 TaxID=2562670 RepID=UPI001182E39E|nr:dihydrolipoyl dehydrogenase [Paraburkholderia sp. BCC1886]